jgi:hypothetical protein
LAVFHHPHRALDLASYKVLQVERVGFENVNMF